ncbi:MAG: hydrogenase maturation protease [Bacteroidetes bacterium]|nr:hydrogenase maturation protease [Bacteroidota bacterium]
MNKDFNSKDTIVFGIGNCGRRDDGLGWAFLDAVKEDGRFKGVLEHRFQLQVEDADLITNYKNVLFVDAYEPNLPDGFLLEKCKPAGKFSFSTHQIEPSSILFLCQDLFEYLPNSHLLIIQGYEWELNNEMSLGAHKNLKKAVAHFLENYTS